jgi:hypothetical protein
MLPSGPGGLANPRRLAALPVKPWATPKGLGQSPPRPNSALPPALRPLPPTPAQAGVDVVIATPGRAVSLLERGALSLADARAIVLDEVDVLAGAGPLNPIPSDSKP